MSCYTIMKSCYWVTVNVSNENVYERTVVSTHKSHKTTWTRAFTFTWQETIGNAPFFNNISPFFSKFYHEKPTVNLNVIHIVIGNSKQP